MINTYEKKIYNIAFKKPIKSTKGLEVQYKALYLELESLLITLKSVFYLPELQYSIC